MPGALTRHTCKAVNDTKVYVQRYTRQVAADLNALRASVGGPLPSGLPQGLKLDIQVFAQVPGRLAFRPASVPAG